MKNIVEESYLKKITLGEITLGEVPEEYRSDKICFAAVEKWPAAIRYIENQTDEICLEAVKKNGLTLKFVKNQTDEICLAAVTENGDALEYVKNQTNEICLNAVKNSGWALEFVETQTDEICLAGVGDNGLAIQFVKSQNLEIINTALKNNSMAVGYVDADIYIYNKEEIKKSIHDACTCSVPPDFQDALNDLLNDLYNNISEIFLRLDNDKIVDVVRNDFKDFFENDLIKIEHEKLYNVKQKYELTCSLLEDGIINPECNDSKTKNKIL